MSVFAIKIPTLQKPDEDLKQGIHQRRWVGLWRLINGYRWAYAFAIISQGVAALAKTSTLLLLSYFIDNVLLQPNPLLLRALPGNAFAAESPFLRNY
ncbi:MAG: hypothetical protein H7Y11_12330, partial [Armatimonadetes bacterium]|nr:hypothetical protein [Anaerolineae bacterium]